MTDFSQYTDRPITRRVRIEAALDTAGALHAKFQAFFANKENRAELRRLMIVFSIQYALVISFVVAAVAFVSGQLNIH